MVKNPIFDHFWSFFRLCPLFILSVNMPLPPSHCPTPFEFVNPLVVTIVKFLCFLFHPVFPSLSHWFCFLLMICFSIELSAALPGQVQWLAGALLLGCPYISYNIYPKASFINTIPSLMLTEFDFLDTGPSLYNITLSSR